MAFLAIPAVASFLSGGAAAGTLASALGTAGAAGLSGAALGAAGSELTGGDWEDGALKGGLGAAGGGLFSGLLGGLGAAGEGAAAASETAATLGEGAAGMGEMGLAGSEIGASMAAPTSFELAAAGLPASEAAAANAVGSGFAGEIAGGATATSPWAEFGLDTLKGGAENVATTGLQRAATPEQTVKTPVAPPPPMDLDDEQLMEFMRRQMQMDPTGSLQLQPMIQ